MSTKQKRVVVRTVRVTKELDEILVKDANLKRTSLNALITSILTKYSEWDRYTEKVGHVSVPTTLLRALLDLITDEDALAKLGDRLGVELASETALFWFKKVNQETLLRFQSLACKYGRAGEIEIKDEELDLTFSIYHSLGKNGSIWFEHYFDKLIRTYLKVIPRIQTSENSVSVRFPKKTI